MSDPAPTTTTDALDAAVAELLDQRAAQGYVTPTPAIREALARLLAGRKGSER